MLFRLIICNQNKNLFKRLLINNEINKTNNSLNLIKSFTTFQNSNNNKLIKLINNSLIKEELIQNNRQLFKRNSSSITKGLIKEENYFKRQSIVWSIIKRNSSSLKGFQNRGLKSRNKNVVLYSTAFVLIVLGMTYAAVPLYRIYCQSTGKGGKPFIDEKAIQKIVKMVKNKERIITVTFSAETTSQMAWDFKPTQHEIRCSPGETVLAFFTAKNPLDVAVNGIATYSVQPYEAGQYLNKIQCFCFEEQRLNPKEEVDLPVFFYIDPEYAEDPKLENVNNIVLSYTFFQAKEGFKVPGFMTSPQNALSLQKL